MTEPRALLDLAQGAARAAGRLLLERFAEPARGVGTKTTPTDLVSDADRDAEELLIARIRSGRPGDGIVAEEGGGGESSTGISWVVDPLDGTVNFLYGIPVWCVSIAVTDADGCLAGIIYDPNRDEMFAAARGKGAVLNSRSIRVSEKTDMRSALVGTGFAYDAAIRARQAEVVARVLPRVRDVRRAGSAALDLANVACGRLDAFYEAHMEEWDKAAGMLIVREAGGKVTELRNPVLDASHGVVAANPALHDALTALVVE